MKRIFLTAFIAVAFLASCKSNKNLTNATVEAAPTPPAVEQPNNFQVSQPAAPTPPATSQSASSNPSTTYTPQHAATNVRTQSETFSFADSNDAAKYDSSSFFVIVGSFSSIENANRYKAELSPKGFSPMVLHSETGYYRVCVNSYSDEHSARVRVDQIRNQYPEHKDCWLLIKK